MKNFKTRSPHNEDGIQEINFFEETISNQTMNTANYNKTFILKNDSFSDSLSDGSNDNFSYCSNGNSKLFINNDFYNYNTTEKKIDNEVEFNSNPKKFPNEKTLFSFDGEKKNIKSRKRKKNDNFKWDPNKRRKVDSFHIPIFHNEEEEEEEEEEIIIKKNKKKIFKTEKEIDNLFLQKIKNLEKNKENRRKVCNTMKIFKKLSHAFDEIKLIEERNDWILSLKPEMKLRVFSFEWNEDFFFYLKNWFTMKNFEQVFGVKNNYFRQSRYFFISTFSKFWSKYDQLPNKLKHFYEIIPEKTPCFLFFDIERTFVKKEIEDKIMENFYQLLFKEFKRMFNIDLTFEENIIDLISSNKKKLSHHIIVKSYSKETKQDMAFENVYECDLFVKNWIEKLKVDKNIEESAKSLFFEHEKKNEFDNNNVEEKSIIDECVYSKNRSFRLLYSRKNAKNSTVLKLSNNISKDRFIDERDLFFQTLITNVKNNPIILKCDKSKCNFISNKRTILKHSLHQFNNYKINEYKNKIKMNNRIKMNNNYEPVYSGNKFSELLKYIIMKNNERGNGLGYVRKTDYFPSTQTLLVYIAENRYCINIGREHKSNHIFYVVNLIERFYKQKCTDYDCKGFSSSYFKIPDYIEIPYQ